MTQVMSKAKWFIPVIVIVAMLAAVGIVWSQSGGSDEVAGFGDMTDANPGYESVIVAPSESTAPVVLYSITVDPPSAVVALGGGDMCTVVVTNLLEGPVSNGTTVASPYMVFCTNPLDLLTYSKLQVNVAATRRGDLVGNIVVTADVWNTYQAQGQCVMSWPDLDTVAGNVSAFPIITVPDIVVHPAASVTFTFPVNPAQNAVPGALFLYKAKFDMTGGTAGMNGLIFASPMTGFLMNTIMGTATPVTQNFTYAYPGVLALPE